MKKKFLALTFALGATVLSWAQTNDTVAKAKTSGVVTMGRA